MNEENKELEVIENPDPTMRIKVIDEKTGKPRYDMKVCKKLSDKQKKFLSIGKKRRTRFNKPKDLDDKTAMIYATVIDKYELEEDCSDAHLVNKVNEFLNKNPRIKKRYFKK